MSEPQKLRLEFDVRRGECHVRASLSGAGGDIESSAYCSTRDVAEFAEGLLASPVPVGLTFRAGHMGSAARPPQTNVLLEVESGSTWTEVILSAQLEATSLFFAGRPTSARFRLDREALVAFSSAIVRALHAGSGSASVSGERAGA